MFPIMRIGYLLDASAWGYKEQVIVTNGTKAVSRKH
jgi:hypothetical protein